MIIEGLKSRTTRKDTKKRNYKQVLSTYASWVGFSYGISGLMHGLSFNGSRLTVGFDREQFVMRPSVQLWLVTYAAVDVGG